MCTAGMLADPIRLQSVGGSCISITNTYPPCVIAALTMASSYSERAIRAIEEAILRATVGLRYTQWRLQQSQVVKLLLHSKDVFMSVPTGNGKSLSYSLLPKPFDHLPKAFDNQESQESSRQAHCQ